MPTLATKLSAQLADGVYGIREQSNVARGFASAQVSEVGEAFDFGSARVLTGISGRGASSGFGLVMRGKGSYSGDIAIVTRGTQTTDDWLSNFVTSAERGPNGSLVHAGFHRIYKSFAQQIQTAIQGNNATKVHCVGHSLGGALANIVAAQMQRDRIGDVEIYTYGAARAGLFSFANQLTTELGAHKIHRVQNMADPVPCVPLWPFRHAPTTTVGLRVASGHGLFSIDAHDMKLYTRLVEGQTWNQLASAAPGVENMRSVDYWIGKAKQQVNFWGSSVVFWALGMALKGMLRVAYRSLGLGVLIGATVIDQVAWLLSRAAELSRELGEQIAEWLSVAMRWVGKAATTTAQVTYEMLRYALELMFRPLAMLARAAADRFGNRGS